MRLVFLDTETTGLAARGDDPHRIVEVGATEMIDWRVTGEEFHRYVDPERDVPEEARRIHGLSREFLRGHPTFAEIYDSLRDFIGEDQAVIHNAPFDSVVFERGVRSPRTRRGFAAAHRRESGDRYPRAGA